MGRRGAYGWWPGPSRRGGREAGGLEVRWNAVEEGEKGGWDDDDLRASPGVGGAEEARVKVASRSFLIG